MEHQRSRLCRLWPQRKGQDHRRPRNVVLTTLFTPERGLLVIPTRDEEGHPNEAVDCPREPVLGADGKGGIEHDFAKLLAWH